MKTFNTDSDISKAVESLKADGGFILEGLVSLTHMQEINEYLNSCDSTYKQLYFDQNWGYGNLLNKSPFYPLLENKWLKQFGSKKFECDFSYNHLVCNEKSPFVGYEVEWHQEVFNIDTFAPGCPPDKSEEYIVQGFIALDNQGPDNGGLMVMPKSNHLGILNCVDVLSPALTHKKSVTVDDLKMAEKYCGIICPELKAGDALIFSPLLIHGSVRNFSPDRRRSLVLQFYSNNIPNRVEGIYEAEIARRSEFVLNVLEQQIQKLTKKDLYDELKKGEK